MSLEQQLPPEVFEAIRATSVCEFATVSKAGVPIDSPTLLFPGNGVTTLDVATGLAYPAKAERARRNPKVGLTLDTLPGRPIVLIAGMARVMDADLQANMNRYLSETVLAPPVSPQFTDWAITQQAVWYLTRIIVSVAPARIRWWNSPEDMDGPPHEWRAPAGAPFPASDPAPPGAISPAPKWPQVPWQELAQRALGNRGGPGGLGYPAHLTFVDADGFPVSIRVSGISGTRDGFRFSIPRGVGFQPGMTTLSYGGLEVFVGETRGDADTVAMTVERALPILPIASEPMQVLEPAPDTRVRLIERLEHETRRRGQAIPTVPQAIPAGTEGARLRGEAAAMLMARMELVKNQATEN